MGGLSDDKAARDAILEQPSRGTARGGRARRDGAGEMMELDPGVLNSRLVAWRRRMQDNVRRGKRPLDGLEGQLGFAYEEARAGLTQIYHRIERSFASYYDVRGVEPSLPRYVGLEQKRGMFQFTPFPLDDDGNPAPYPPHLKAIPEQDEVPLTGIFNTMGLLETQGILRGFVPQGEAAKALWWLLEQYDGDVSGLADQEPTMKAIEEYNREHRKRGTDIEGGRNIGLLEDWYSDRRFADQALSGVDPTTIERVSDRLLGEFVEAAAAGGDEHWAAELRRIPREELFVTDCSWLREAVGAGPGEELKSLEPGGEANWACASVTLYRLQDNGQLHPVAIVVDYRGSMRESVTIFNRATQAAAPDAEARGVPEQEADWPWRYAKMCAQASAWIRHEVGTHLTLAHFVEEALIVATNRAVPMDHIVFRLLEPHWYKTLSLNAAARSSLVPDVVQQVVGLTPDQLHAFIRHEFTSFDYTGGYVPNDLRRRGFPDTPAGLAGPRWRDCAYAKNALGMWRAIRRYARAMLLTHYDERDADAQVAADPHVAAWAREVQGPAHIPSFPSIATLDALVDAVTMSIHIAAPFHTAVNYLQNFYLAFVPSRPPALSAAPPATIAQLRAYREPDLVRALPVGQRRQWLLAVQVPWLLSFKVSADLSLRTFAESQSAVHRGDSREDVLVREASERLCRDLDALADDMVEVSRGMNEGSIPYIVLDPDTTAVSILI